MESKAMTPTPQSEIAPYQSIDILLAGERLQELKPPVAGFVVTFPDNKLDAIMLTEAKATPERLIQLQALSKWPDQVFYRKAWLHSEQALYGHIQKRNFWSPR